MIRCRRNTICFLLVGLLIAVWLALAVWQYREYAYERGLTERTLYRQAEAVGNALVGGINSHRRMRMFFEDQISGVLREVAKAEDILAVRVSLKGKEGAVDAGDVRLLDLPGPLPGHCYRYSDTFELVPSELGGGGGGGGRGGGFGRGLGAAMAPPEEAGRFGEGGVFRLLLILDRSRLDAHDRRGFWLRVWVVVAGGLVLMCVAAAWVAAVRYMEARSRTRLLESETRRLRELSLAAAGLAHETRNPLGLVRGWTQRLAKSELGSEGVRQQAKAVVEECDRVTARINQFLSFARPCEPKTEPVDLEALLGELAIILEPDLDAKELRMVCRCEPPHRMAQVDRELFRQALFNLMTNAIQFSNPGDEVEARATTGHAGGCRIEVLDRGPGAEEGAAQDLFNPYFTTRPEGTGLGLAIVRRIAEAHGWSVGYSPRPGGGAIFWMDQHDAR